MNNKLKRKMDLITEFAISLEDKKFSDNFYGYGLWFGTEIVIYLKNGKWVKMLTDTVSPIEQLVEVYSENIENSDIKNQYHAYSPKFSKIVKFSCTIGGYIEVELRNFVIDDKIEHIESGNTYEIDGTPDPEFTIRNIGEFYELRNPLGLVEYWPKDDVENGQFRLCKPKLHPNHHIHDWLNNVGYDSEVGEFWASSKKWGSHPVFSLSPRAIEYMKDFCDKENLNFEKFHKDSSTFIITAINHRIGEQRND